MTTRRDLHCNNASAFCETRPQETPLAQLIHGHQPISSNARIPEPSPSGTDHRFDSDYASQASFFFASRFQVLQIQRDHPSSEDDGFSDLSYGADSIDLLVFEEYFRIFFSDPTGRRMKSRSPIKTAWTRNSYKGPGPSSPRSNPQIFTQTPLSYSNLYSIQQHPQRNVI